MLDRSSLSPVAPEPQPENSTTILTTRPLVTMIANTTNSRLHNLSLAPPTRICNSDTTTKMNNDDFGDCLQALLNQRDSGNSIARVSPSHSATPQEAWRQQIVGDDDSNLLLSFRYFVH